MASNVFTYFSTLSWKIQSLWGGSDLCLLPLQGGGGEKGTFGDKFLFLFCLATVLKKVR